MSIPQALLSAGPNALYALIFHATPLAGYALTASRVPKRTKLLLVLVAALTATAFWPWLEAIKPQLVDVLLSWSYLLLGACSVHLAVRPLRRVGCTTAGLLGLATTIFMLVPCLLFRNSATLFLLAAGFELSFSAHSYWAEMRQSASPSKLGNCLVFLLVNPTLVYPARGRDLGIATLSKPAIARTALGIAGLLCAPSLTAGLAVLVPVMRARLPGLMVASCFTILLYLLSQYFVHSSLASFQIGAMRLMGHELPERYNYPFLARSPEDLWRRWNIYLGTWLQRYVYVPVAMRYQRRLAPKRWYLAKAASVIVVFAVCGLAHEIGGYALRLTWPLGGLLGFLFYGAVFAFALLLREWTDRALRKRPALRSRATGRVAVALSAAASFGALLLFGWITLPALGGFGLPEDLLRWVLP